MNTRFRYQYVDAENFKEAASAVLPGSITQEQVERIRRACYDHDTMFVPNQVGLCGLAAWCSYGPVYDYDGPYHYVDGFESTDDAPTEQFGAEELARRFEEASAEGWAPERYGWIDPEQLEDE